MMKKILPRLGGVMFDFGLRLVPIVLLGIITLASFWFLKKNTLSENPPPDRLKVHKPDYVFIDVKLTVLNPDGSTKYRLLGKEFKHYEDDAVIEVEVPRLRLFNPKAPPLTLTAQSGHVTGDLDIVELYKNAEISRPEELNRKGVVINPHLLMQSDYLKFFINDDQMQTHLPIHIERGDSIMDASKGATYDNINQAVSMFGDVKGSIAPTTTNQNTIQ
jgi:lipopolysaccharide export system protein LptC